jgi:hypothetical protein
MGGEKAMNVRDVAVNCGDVEAFRINAAGVYRVVVGDPNKYGVSVSAVRGRLQCSYGVAWSEIDAGGKCVVVDYINRAMADVERQRAALRKDVIANLLKGGRWPRSGSAGRSRTAR